MVNVVELEPLGREHFLQLVRILLHAVELGNVDSLAALVDTGMAIEHAAAVAALDEDGEDEIQPRKEDEKEPRREKIKVRLKKR